MKNYNSEWRKVGFRKFSDHNEFRFYNMCKPHKSKAIFVIYLYAFGTSEFARKSNVASISVLHYNIKHCGVMLQTGLLQMLPRLWLQFVGNILSLVYITSVLCVRSTLNTDSSDYSTRLLIARRPTFEY